jgi:hypothetical protein
MVSSNKFMKIEIIFFGKNIIDIEFDYYIYFFFNLLKYKICLCDSNCRDFCHCEFNGIIKKWKTKIKLDFPIYIRVLW